MNFDEVMNRRDTGSMKWDVKENELPLWVADMDFPTAPAVREAIEERAKLGIFGYEILPDRWAEAYMNWWDRRYHLKIEKDSLIFCTGVVPAISCAVKRMTNTGDSVLVMTPVYDIFFHSIENHGRHVLESPLLYEDGVYGVDFEDLEEKLSRPLTTMMILCNPHNPVGKIWSSEELEKIGNLCKRHHVVLLSDEIHCDLTKPGTAYIPFAAVSEVCAQNSITCLAASKAFNLAGMQSAAVMIPNEGIRNVMNRGLNSDEIAEPGSFAVPATVAALTKGEEWLAELNEYLWNNRQIAETYIGKMLPQIHIVSGEATYLMWMDVNSVLKDGEDSEKLCSYIREKTGLYLSGGSQYRGNGHHFLRMNLACPKVTLQDALDRLKTGVEDYEA